MRENWPFDPLCKFPSAASQLLLSCSTSFLATHVIEITTFIHEYSKMQKEKPCSKTRKESFHIYCALGDPGSRQPPQASALQVSPLKEVPCLV